MKFVFKWPSSFWVDERMTETYLYYFKLTHESKDSGELIITLYICGQYLDHEFYEPYAVPLKIIYYSMKQKKKIKKKSKKKIKHTFIFMKW